MIKTAASFFWLKSTTRHTCKTELLYWISKWDIQKKRKRKAENAGLPRRVTDKRWWNICSSLFGRMLHSFFSLQNYCTFLLFRLWDTNIVKSYGTESKTRWDVRFIGGALRTLVLGEGLVGGFWLETVWRFFQVWKMITSWFPDSVRLRVSVHRELLF